MTDYEKQQLLGTILRLTQENERLKKELQEVAYYIEKEICLRTHFTGEPPYVGWKGLGLAMVEHMEGLKNANGN